MLRNAIYPGHAVSWTFEAPATASSVGILIPDATRTRFTAIVYNLEAASVKATMTGWQIDPGQWEVTGGVDADGDDRIDGPGTTRVVTFERSVDLPVTFAPKTTTILSLKLVKPGTPYWARPDLGLNGRDLPPTAGPLAVTVHNVGSVRSPATTVGVVTADGRVIASAPVPPIDAPLDLHPKTVTVRVPLTVPPGTSLKGARVMIDPGNELREITKRNNAVGLGYQY